MTIQFEDRKVRDSAPIKKYIIVLDSCTFKSFHRAKTPNMDRVGKPIKGYSWSNFTFPVFMTMISMNMMPRPHFKRFARSIDYPGELKKNGIHLHFNSDNPHLHPLIFPTKHFQDRFTSFKCHQDPMFNSATEIIKHGTRNEDRFVSWLWFGNTHQPYDCGEDHTSDWDRTTRILSNCNLGNDSLKKYRKLLHYLQGRQITAVEYIDTLLGDIIDSDWTDMVITSDHGESFGEGGWYGHGISIDKSQFEVPLIEVNRE